MTYRRYVFLLNKIANGWTIIDVILIIMKHLHILYLKKLYVLYLDSESIHNIKELKKINMYSTH